MTWETNKYFQHELKSGKKLELVPLALGASAQEDLKEDIIIPASGMFALLLLWYHPFLKCCSLFLFPAYIKC